MPRTHALILAAVLATLAGCATTSTPVNTAGNRIDVDSYRLLAELALAEQRGEEAAEHYLSAAMISDDPAFAQRAAQMALQLGLDTLGHRAVARWRELEPNGAQIDYYSGILETRSGRVDAAVGDFSALLENLPETDLGPGFSVIRDALVAEPFAGTAARVMRELAARFPGVPEAHFALAQLALRAGGFSLALDESRTAIELADEAWPDAELLHARTLVLAGRSAEALEIASELATEYDNIGVRLQFAELLLSAGETERAESLLNEMLEQNPGMPEAIRALAFLSLSQENLEDARERFEMLRSYSDYRDETYYFLGRIAELELDYLQATRSYTRVTDGARAVDAQVRTSNIYYEEMDDPDSALRHLSDFGDANPRFAPEMLLAQAELLLRMNRAEEAIALIDDAIGEDGEIADQNLQNAHVAFYSTLMEDALDRGNIESAEAWIEEGLARYPGNRNLRYSESRLLQEQGRLRPAVRILEDLVEESPDNAIFLNALGYVLTDRLDRHNEARDYIQRALAMDPENGAILDSMGWVLFHLGELDLALNYLERAYRSLPVTEVMAHLIDVHWALGNREQAREMLEEALAENPGDAFLTDVRGRLRQ